MARLRERPWPFLLASAVGVGWFLWFLSDTADVGRTRVRYEDLALERVRAVARAEAAYHERRKRYGWLEDLERAGLVKDLPVAAEGTERYVESPRYRIDVLLPHTVNRDDMAQIALRSAGRRDDALEAKHFSVVARPWGDDLTGFRTFCIDESGRIYVSEGVSDMAARRNRPLPELHLTRGSPIVTGGMRWYPIDALPDR